MVSEIKGGTWSAPITRSTPKTGLDFYIDEVIRDANRASDAVDKIRNHACNLHCDEDGFSCCDGCPFNLSTGCVCTDLCDAIYELICILEEEE